MAKILLIMLLMATYLLFGCATQDRYTNPQVTEGEWTQLHGPWAPKLHVPYQGPPLEEMLF